jgi:hypothetical protein
MFGTLHCSKDDTARMNELLCQVLRHNTYVVIQSMYDLEIEADVGQTAQSVSCVN